MWVAGVDGCRDKWLVVFRSLADSVHTARIVDTIEDVIAAPEQPKRIAVDIPIGLPSISQRGGRAADREVRKALGRDRQSSVFPTPSRPTLAARSFEDACAIELRNSQPPKKVSQQVFHILDKIRQVDLAARRSPGLVFECHPEVSFWAMNNETAMTLPKKVSRRKDPSGLSQSGLDERRNLLVRNGYTNSFLTTRIEPPSRYAADDFVDACVAAWTAERILNGSAKRFPPSPEHDEFGLDMVIWA